MSRRIHRGGIAVAALALALLATPVHAAGLNGWGLPSGTLLHAWHWLTGGWTRAAPVEPHGRGRSTVKEGMGVDPNGGHSLGTGSTTGSTPAPTESGSTGSSGG
ncbi:MAG: hypothetical protein ACJ76Y_23085 [Thermoanaerobaculia bacterium]